MSTDRLIGHYRNHTYDSGIDLIISSSLFHSGKLAKFKMLHSLDHLDTMLNLEPRYFSAKYDFIVLGLDPYVFIEPYQTTGTLRTYSDLKNKQFLSTCEAEDIIPFLASVMPKLRKEKTYSWMKNFMINRVSITEFPDTLRTEKTILSSLSTFKKTIKKGPYNRLRYPNEFSEGSFYDAWTVSILNQSEQYTEALKFIHFCHSPAQNRRLNEHFGTLSIYQKSHRLYRMKPEDLIPYYAYIERLYKKLS